MKSFLAVALALLTLPAFAQTAVDTNANSDSSSQSGAQAGSQSALSFHSGDQIRQAPSIGVPSMGVSFAQDNCSGAASAGASFPGGSVAFGKSTKDIGGCEERRNAEKTAQLSALFAGNGDRDTAAALRQAALNIMCAQDPMTYAAYALAGVKCQLLPSGKPVDPYYPTIDELREFREQKQARVSKR